MHRTCHTAKHNASLMIPYTKSTLDLLGGKKEKSIIASTEAGFVSISFYFNMFTMCLSILDATTRYGNKTEVDSFPRSPIQFKHCRKGLSPPAPKTSRGYFLSLVPTSLCSHHGKVKNAYIKYLAWDSVAENIHANHRQQSHLNSNSTNRIHKSINKSLLCICR